MLGLNATDPHIHRFYVSHLCLLWFTWERQKVFLKAIGEHCSPSRESYRLTLSLSNHFNSLQPPLIPYCKSIKQKGFLPLWWNINSFSGTNESRKKISWLTACDKNIWRFFAGIKVIFYLTRIYILHTTIWALHYFEFYCLLLFLFSFCSPAIYVHRVLPC